MHLYELPLFFALTGVAAYAVLAGADFGAGIWQLLAGRGERGKQIRAHTHHSMSPVWEANHVWLIFVLVVLWTAYPLAFSSMSSTLAVPLFIAGLGIILRGVAYALRTATTSEAELRAIDTLSAVGSLLAPFALAAAAGAVASLRVPVGNAEGDLFSSWLNPTSVMAGVLAVISSAYLAAVYLAADARREGKRELAATFRTRALLAGSVAGAAAIVGALVVRSDVRRTFDALLEAPAVFSVAVSLGAGVGTLALVYLWRLEAARVTGALAVAALLGGWALAQNPVLLEGLTVKQAAAPDSLLIPLVIAIVAGGVILFPALALLFRLALGGTFATRPQHEPRADRERPLVSVGSGRLAVLGLAIGAPFLFFAETGWTHAVGMAGLTVFMTLGFNFLTAGDAYETDDTHQRG